MPTFASRFSLNLDKAIVEGEIVSQRILPSLSILSIVRKVIHDPLVDSRQRQHLLLRTLYSHSSECDVRIRRLASNVRASTRSRHSFAVKFITLCTRQVCNFVWRMMKSCRAYKALLAFVYHVSWSSVNRVRTPSERNRNKHHALDSSTTYHFCTSDNHLYATDL